MSLRLNIILLKFTLLAFVALSSGAQGQVLGEDSTRIGQTLMVGFTGKRTQDRGVQALCRNLSAGRVGGVIFYGRNIQTKAQVKTLVTHLKRCGGLYQPIIAIDQEGGLVDRLGYRHFPNTTRRFYASRFGDLGNTSYKTHYIAMVRDVAALGFDVNFAPVADIDRNPNNPIVGRLGRAYGTTANEVNGLLPWLIDQHDRQGVATSIKHFPGHGSSTTDSHKAFTDVTSSWSNQELEPFMLIANEPQTYASTSIMVGHLVHRQLDPSGAPASLSHTMVTGLLREGMQFDGAIISDDMAMNAISNHYGWGEAARRAMVAGIDMVIMADGSQSRIDQYHAALSQALSSGALTRQQLGDKQARLDQWVRRSFPSPNQRPTTNDL